MQSKNITNHIEALIFSSDQSISSKEINSAINAAFNIELDLNTIEKYLEVIREKYELEHSILKLVLIDDGYQFLTKEIYHDTINQLQSFRAKRKLSQAALETLSIIAYKQPITKLEIEQIRGVNSDYSVQRLLEKDLIAIDGKAETVGRPILYKTSRAFVDYFGLKNLKDLPQLKDFAQRDNTIGEETF